MLLNSTAPISEPTALAIVRAVLAIDTLAQVQVDSACQQVWIDGRLSAHQAVAALRDAGCEAQVADEPAWQHDQGGRTCCGSCG